jgi:hypothetical protein
MRFFITGDKSNVEVIGHEVEFPVVFPSASGGVFAVHHNAVPTDEDARMGRIFVVSHVETGFRVAAAETIDGAIDGAAANLLETGPSVFMDRLSAVRKYLVERDAA